MSFVKDFSKQFSHGQLQFSKSNLWLIYIHTYIDCYKMSYKVRGKFDKNYGNSNFNF